MTEEEIANLYKVDYDNFDFLKILREELEMEKQLMARAGGGKNREEEEGEQERFMREMEEREK